MTSIKEILERYNVALAPSNHHHSTPHFVQCECPYCSPNSGKFRLGIAKNGRAATCWTCGKHSTFHTIRLLTDAPYDELKQLLGGIAEPIAIPAPRGRLQVPRGVGPLKYPHEKYLRARGFDPAKIAKLWGVQGIGLASRLAWRLFIPCFQDGEMVSWTTRALGNDELRYVSARPEEERVPLKSCLYGAEYARHAVVVCEGPSKVWAVGPGACCTFGVVVTDAQVAKIAAYPVRAVLLDGEPQAQQRARELCRLLEPMSGETHCVTLESAAQADEADPQELAEIRKKFLDD